MAKKKGKPIPKERVVVLVVAGVLSAVPIVWVLWPRPPSLSDPARGYAAVCPAAPGHPLVVVEYDSRYHDNEDYPDRSYTDFFYRYSVYDPTDGRTLHRVSLGQQRSGTAPDCFFADGGNVWMWTQRDGFHVRAAATGEVVKAQAELLPGLPAAVVSAGFEPAARRLVVSTKDGRHHAVDASFAAEVVASAATASTGAPARAVPGSGMDRDGTRVRQWIRDQTTTGTVTEERADPRRTILVDGEPLAGTDWLKPQYVVHAPTGSLEWPDPPSLVICEPAELDAPPQQLTRVGLDGTILWTYRPGAKRAGNRPDCMWRSSGDGGQLILFTEPNGIVGLDAATGAERFRRAM
jgi:hypothetical protein